MVVTLRKLLVILSFFLLLMISLFSTTLSSEIEMRFVFACCVWYICAAIDTAGVMMTWDVATCIHACKFQPCSSAAVGIDKSSRGAVLDMAQVSGVLQLSGRSMLANKAAAYFYWLFTSSRKYQAVGDSFQVEFHHTL